MELYAGLDFHSRNTYIGIMDKAFNRVFKKRVPNHLENCMSSKGFDKADFREVTLSVSSKVLL